MSRPDHQRLDPDPRRRHLQQGGQDRRRRARSGPRVPGAAAGIGAGADPVRHRAVVLRTEFDRHGDAVGADRDGGVHQHQGGALAAPHDHPHHRHRAGRAGDGLVWREGHRAVADPQPGGAEPATAVRDRAAGDVHRQPRQDGRVRGAALADHVRGADRRHHHRAQRQAGAGFRDGLGWFILG